MSPSDDQREHERITRSSNVLHRELVIAQHKPSYNEGRLIDLSAQGLSFASQSAYAADDVLELRLMLYGWEAHKSEFYTGDPRKATDPLVVIGRVVDAQPDGSGWRIGVAFENIDPSHQHALERWLKRERDGSL